MRDSDSRSPGLSDKAEIENVRSRQDEERLTLSFVVRGSEFPDGGDVRGVGHRSHETDDALEGKELEIELWQPKRVPERLRLLSPDDIARMRLIWLSFGLLSAVVLLGLLAVFVLSMLRIDTMPMMQFLSMVIAPAFTCGVFALGYYFGKRKKSRSPAM